MAKKRYYDNSSDGSMINSDSSAMANLPQDVKIIKYPSTSGYLNENLNDGMSGIDGQMKKDNSKKISNLQPEKY